MADQKITYDELSKGVQSILLNFDSKLKDVLKEVNSQMEKHVNGDDLFLSDSGFIGKVSVNGAGVYQSSGGAPVDTEASLAPSGTVQPPQTATQVTPKQFVTFDWSSKTITKNSVGLTVLLDQFHDGGAFTMGSCFIYAFAQWMVDWASTNRYQQRYAFGKRLFEMWWRKLNAALVVVNCYTSPSPLYSTIISAISQLHSIAYASARSCMTGIMLCPYTCFFIETDTGFTIYSVLPFGNSQTFQQLTITDITITENQVSINCQSSQHSLHSNMYAAVSSSLSSKREIVYMSLPDECVLECIQSSVHQFPYAISRNSLFKSVALLLRTAERPFWFEPTSYLMNIIKPHPDLEYDVSLQANYQNLINLSLVANADFPMRVSVVSTSPFLRD